MIIKLFSKHKEYKEALQWYREFIDLHDPDHHINYHRIKSGGKGYLERGYIRVQLKGAELTRDFVVAGHTLLDMEEAVEKARRYRDKLPSEVITLRKRAKQHHHSPTFPGIYDNWVRRKAWSIEGISARTNRKSLVQFTAGEYGSERLAMVAAIQARKKQMVDQYKNKPMRRLVDKYRHLFD